MRCCARTWLARARCIRPSVWGIGTHAEDARVGEARVQPEGCGENCVTSRWLSWEETSRRAFRRYIDLLLRTFLGQQKGWWNEASDCPLRQRLFPSMEEPTGGRRRRRVGRATQTGKLGAPQLHRKGPRRAAYRCHRVVGRPVGFARRRGTPRSVARTCSRRTFIASFGKPWRCSQTPWSDSSREPSTM